MPRNVPRKPIQLVDYEAAMEQGPALPFDAQPSDVRPARRYVVLVCTETGQMFRSIPFAEYETAEKVARFSQLDADVVEVHIEKVCGRNGEAAEELRC
jgi:hypothetical protein